MSWMHEVKEMNMWQFSTIDSSGYSSIDIFEGLGTFTEFNLFLYPESPLSDKRSPGIRLVTPGINCQGVNLR